VTFVHTAVYPGSFDPLTNGHMDVLKQALQLFDQVVIAVLDNPGKTPLFCVRDRVKMIQEITANMRGVTVDSFSGLLADYVKLKQACAVIRGLRDTSDFENELRMAHMNRELNKDVVTVLLPTNHEYSFVSSTLVKDVAMHGGDVRPFVPDIVAREMSARYSVNQD
jgi:pantetheine-phosphate adenylyltransferase